MNNRFKAWCLLTVCLVLAAPVQAEGFYAGLGVSSNSYAEDDMDFDTATGFQAFAGYRMEGLFGSERLMLDMEVGFFDSGEFEADSSLGPTTVESASGANLSAVLGFKLTSSMALTARGGYDAGDDDGVLAGIGARWQFNERMGLSGEFVGRNHIDSLQLNLQFGF